MASTGPNITIRPDGRHPEIAMPSRPYGHVFRPTSPNYLPMSQFYTDAAAGNLAQVVWIDLGNDEHPPRDIRAGQQEVAQVITAIRSSPAWSTSIVFLTYDEHGGAYDHVRPPAATPPDNIAPGLCADNSNPPGSLQPGGGAQLHGEFCRSPVDLSFAASRRAVPGRLRGIRSARYQGSVRRHFTVRQAGLRLACGQRPYLNSGLDREALYARRASHRPRRRGQHAGGPV